tara:strand:- start:166 stop:375 length:210 start_codon:yes stop_codon:yes gene_type:complete
MKLTPKMLRTIIKEEMTKFNNRQRLAEGTRENPVQITPEYLNRIIREEYTAFQEQQRLAESRRRRRRRS